MFRIRLAIILGVALGLASPVRAQREFGFVNTRPSGQPYLSPEESVKRMQVPPGWEVTVFAAEPDVINPISFSIDERGRVWVVECYEYPKRTPKGKKPRDRIKILEDTTGSGKADKVTLWADGKDLPAFDMASGIEVGHGGVFLGAAPYLMYLRDTKGAGKCDSCEILLRGFGSQDTHETLNTMQWGPDGRLYGLHGIFTQSRIGEVQMNAAVWRYDARGKVFDIFAEGTSNPWGLDFDAHGQAFLAACVIPHCFHMIPGGTYIRQAGASNNPYAFGLLREISDHQHHAESGWAHAGTLVLEGEHVPAEFRNSLLMGSIHGCSVKRDVLTRRGSTFVARHAPDFLVSGDKNFRPINMRWGPDGAIYLIDWHDQNPCHQAQPDSWDMTHGRIYKIQRKAAKSNPPGDLSRKSSAELVQLLSNDNPWWYRTALRLLNERRDASVAAALSAVLFDGKNDVRSLRALWALDAVGAFDPGLAERALQHASPWVRAWTVRSLGESGKVADSILRRFEQMAREDAAPEVRLQLASTAHRLNEQEVLPLLQGLMAHKEDALDPCIPLMIWLAYEPRLANEKHDSLAWLGDHAVGNPLIAQEIIPRAVRRLVVTGKPEDLERAVAFVGRLSDSQSRKRALDGILEGLASRQTDPPAVWRTVFTALLEDRDAAVRKQARRLAVQLRDHEAVKASLAIVVDVNRSQADRIEAARDVAIAHPPEALQALTNLLRGEKSPELLTEICRALAGYSGTNVARAVLSNWKQYAPAVRTEALNLLAGRKEWAQELLAAVGRKEVARAELNDNLILRLHAYRDKKLNSQIEAVWGKVRENTPAELNKLIEKMRASLNQGPSSFERGRVVFEVQCAKCHRFEGKGHDVGPNLEGAARDIDYLLVNVLDPNRVVGQPYYIRLVVFKNGRIETGLLAAEDERTLTLKGENNALKVIQKAEIEEVTIQEKSLMPEGLNNTMPVQDFRDLIRYLMASPFLTDVEVAGPFPKQAVSSAGRLQLPEGPAFAWKTPDVGPAGKIPLPAVHGTGELYTYVSAPIQVGTAFKTRLQLGAIHPVEIWLNGKSIYKSQPGKAPLVPDQEGVDLLLEPGINTVLVEIQYKGSNEGVYLRLLDPGRKLTHGAK